jgi:hypothetical protein
MAAREDTGKGRREERRDKGKIKQGEWRKRERFIDFYCSVRL